MGQYFQVYFIPYAILELLLSNTEIDKQLAKNNKIFLMCPNHSGFFAHTSINDGFMQLVELFLYFNKGYCVIWNGDYFDKEIFNGKFCFYVFKLLYKKKLSVQVLKKKFFQELLNKKTCSFEKKFFVNHSKNLFFDMKNCSINPIHPLPILTYAGGLPSPTAYSGTNMELIGTWTGDLISFETDEKALANKNEFLPNFLNFDVLLICDTCDDIQEGFYVYWDKSKNKWISNDRARVGCCSKENGYLHTFLKFNIEFLVFLEKKNVNGDFLESILSRIEQDLNLKRNLINFQNFEIEQGENILSTIVETENFN